MKPRRTGEKRMALLRSELYPLPEPSRPLPETAADEVTGERGVFCLYCLSLLVFFHSNLYTLYSLFYFSLIHITHCITHPSIHCFSSLLFSSLGRRHFYFQPALLLRIVLGVRTSSAPTPLASAFAYTPYLLVPPPYSWTAAGAEVATSLCIPRAFLVYHYSLPPFSQTPKSEKTQPIRRIRARESRNPQHTFIHSIPPSTTKNSLSPRLAGFVSRFQLHTLPAALLPPPSWRRLHI